MNKTLITTLLLSIQLPVFAANAMSDLAPTQRDLDRTTDRIQQEHDQRELKWKQQKERVPSEAERRINRIPKSTTVMPTYEDGGGSIHVTIPN